MEPELDAFMRAAIHQAQEGRSEGGIPIGSALARGGVLLAVGRNRRVQDDDPITHAEIDCLRRVGRIGSYRATTLYSTLMPCYLCAGAAIQFGIPRVVVGESRNFSGAGDLMRSHGIEVVDLDARECVEMMSRFVAEKPELWSEDIGD